jgi:hypothetical protein
MFLRNVGYFHLATRRYIPEYTTLQKKRIHLRTFPSAVELNSSVLSYWERVHSPYTGLPIFCGRISVALHENSRLFPPVKKRRKRDFAKGGIDTDLSARQKTKLSSQTEMLHISHEN